MPRVFRRKEKGLSNKVYYAWVPKPSGRGLKKVSTGFTDRRAAELKAIELEREAADPDGSAKARATLRDALELLIKDRRAQAKAGKRSAETVDFYAKKSGVLLAALPEVLKRPPEEPILLAEVDGSLVDRYIELRREDGVAESTIAKELTTWRAAMRIAKRRKMWSRDIDEVFPRFGGESATRHRYLHLDEVVKLHDAMVRPLPLRGRKKVGPIIGRQNFAIVAYAIATSAEWSAIWRARRSEVAADLGMAKVRGSKNDRRERDSAVTLPEFAWLLKYALDFGDGHGDTLFSPHLAHNLRKQLREACIKAKIPHLCPTDLRRTHSTWLVNRGVSTSAIFPSMGHADSKMLDRRYGRPEAGKVAELQTAQAQVHATALKAARSGPITEQGTN